MKKNYLSEVLIISEEKKSDFTNVLLDVAATSGWVNLEPAVDDDRKEELSGMFAWFSARGPKVPIGTVVSESDSRFISIGLSHGLGRDASSVLQQAGLHPPEEWILRQEHPKRGFVWEIEAEKVAVNGIADFLMGSTFELCLSSDTGVREWIVSVNRLD